MNTYKVTYLSTDNTEKTVNIVASCKEASLIRAFFDIEDCVKTISSIQTI